MSTVAIDSVSFASSTDGAAVSSVTKLTLDSRFNVDTATIDLRGMSSSKLSKAMTMIVGVLIRSTNLSYVEVKKGVKVYNLSNEWNEMTPVDGIEDCCCSLYMSDDGDCALRTKKISFEDLQQKHVQKGNYVYCITNKNWWKDSVYEIEYTGERKFSSFEHDDAFSKKVMKLFNLVLKTHDMKKIQVLFDTDVVLANNCGINDDHRGSNHTRVRLDFNDKWSIPSSCCLYDVACAVYRIKSHKWDNNYELFAGCTARMTRSKEDSTVRGITINCYFDHGS